MFRSILAFLVLASSALVLGATTHAQQSKPSGSFGYFAFVETSSGADRLTILHPELCPTGPCATFSLNAPMAQSQNRVNFEMPTAPGIGIGFDNTSPFPVVLVPTHLPNVLGFGPTFVEIVDFRAAPTSPPATCSSAGLNLCLDGGSIPYEILTVPGSGFAYVAEDSSVTGSLVLHQIYFGNGSVPSLNARWVLPQSSTSYASRLEVDPITSRIVVPMLNGIATVDPTNPLGASILIAPAPVDAFGLAYEVGTNVRTDFFGSLGDNILAGLRSSTLAGATPTPGHSFLSIDAGVTVTRTGGIDPFWPTGTLAIGFHEIAITYPAGSPVASFLWNRIDPATGLPVGGGVGSLDALTYGIGSAQIPIAPVAMTVVGNPEAPRLGLDPIGFMGVPIGIIPGGFGIGSASLAGPIPVITTAPVAAAGPTGNIDFTSADRPYNLPGTNQWVLPFEGAFNGSRTYTLTPGAAPVVSATLPAPGPPSSAISVLDGPVPVILATPITVQGFADFMGTNVTDEQLIVGPPYATPPVALTFDDTVPAVPLPTPPAVYPFVFGSATNPGGPGARRPAFNFTVKTPTPELLTAIPGRMANGAVLKIYQLGVVQPIYVHMTRTALRSAIEPF